MSLKARISKLPGYNRVVLPYHHVKAWHAASKNDYPAAGMRVIGVTGTNGKSTTSFMIFHMLKEAGYKVGLMTTVAYGTWQKIHDETMHMTTTSPGLLNKRISDMREAGVEYLVLEVTSHALAQGRVFGVPIEVAVMTNLTHEHLDYHRTFERYREAKTRLFSKADFGIINADDAHAANFAVFTKKHITYGIKNGKLRAESVKLGTNGVEYVISDINLKITTQIPGEFNVYNSLAAAAVGQYLGLSKTQIRHGIASLKGVEGRMARIDEGQKFEVIVDYAHTPDSFEKLLGDMRRTIGKKRRLLVMFGSAGRRDEAKRAAQGAIAGKYADVLVLTEEDDRDVDGNKILNQIEAGAKKAGAKKIVKILNRKKAIEFILDQAKKDDAVMLLGKGHEKTIERADGEHAWDEIKIVRGILKSRKKK
ncbi:UDP-N-acetylmuramoyl-L-alanyl-D-glutamate--2,6-diaminopimelate ligase [Candidatus Saccharibacteria bacterium]|nr:UDP-N-acetylmuramoyl-L-alanyl-D-glutamate--2,6-diaminopimelate ligase [Candidatus Saccharibacteria bacterium]